MFDSRWVDVSVLVGCRRFGIHVGAESNFQRLRVPRDGTAQSVDFSCARLAATALVGVALVARVVSMGFTSAQRLHLLLLPRRALWLRGLRWMSQCQEGDRALEKADELHAQQSRATCLHSGVGLLLAIVLCRLQVERTVDTQRMLLKWFFCSFVGITIYDYCS